MGEQVFCGLHVRSLHDRPPPAREIAIKSSRTIVASASLRGTLHMVASLRGASRQDNRL
jgi:hypothetical protein